VTNVGGTASLFLRYGALRALALLVLAVAFFLHVFGQLDETIQVISIDDGGDPTAAAGKVHRFMLGTNLINERGQTLPSLGHPPLTYPTHVPIVGRHADTCVWGLAGAKRAVRAGRGPYPPAFSSA
jgi:hypothetical protein